jgi:hypothetical protein
VHGEGGERVSAHLTIVFLITRPRHLHHPSIIHLIVHLILGPLVTAFTHTHNNNNNHSHNHNHNHNHRSAVEETPGQPPPSRRGQPLPRDELRPFTAPHRGGARRCFRRRYFGAAIENINVKG